MLRKRLLTGMLCASALAVLGGCARPTESAAGPAPVLSSGAEASARLRAQSATTSVRTIPAIALFTSGPYGIYEKLNGYGRPAAANLPILVDGKPRFGHRALDGLAPEDIERVDLIRSTWGGMTGNPLNPELIVSVTTKKAAAAAK